MSDKENPAYDTCKSCGVELTAETVGRNIWWKPYCPACWPSECPNCGGENYYWLFSHDRFHCDNGCHNHAEIKL